MVQLRYNHDDSSLFWCLPGFGTDWLSHYQHQILSLESCEMLLHFIYREWSSHRGTPLPKARVDQSQNSRKWVLLSYWASRQSLDHFWEKNILITFFVWRFCIFLDFSIFTPVLYVNLTHQNKMWWTFLAIFYKSAGGSLGARIFGFLRF